MSDFNPRNLFFWLTLLGLMFVSGCLGGPGSSGGGYNSPDLSDAQSEPADDPLDEPVLDTSEPVDLPLNDQADLLADTQEPNDLGTDQGYPPDPTLPPEIQAIARELEPSFLNPNKGLSLRLIAPLLPAMPNDALSSHEQPWLIQTELRLHSGRVISWNRPEQTFAAIYSAPGYPDYLYISSESESLDELHTTYTATILQPMSVLSWMKAAEVDTISGDYYWITVYRSGFVDRSTYLVCPVLAGSSNASSGMQVHFDADTLEPNHPLGVMVNSYLTENRRTIAYLSGVQAYHQSCQCYDVVGSGYQQRSCNAEDVPSPPTIPRALSPEDGQEGVSLQTHLTWSSSAAPNRVLSYDLYFGTTSPPSSRVFSETARTSWQPSLQTNTTYFWQVLARDDAGQEVMGPVFTFNTDLSIPELDEHTYLIVVDKRLQGEIDDELAQYVEDILLEGNETPAVRYWMPGGHEMLKALIRESYDTHGIRGVFLIGDLPSAWFEQEADFGDGQIMHEEFPIEIYFQDMRGIWSDSDGNGIYDAHSGIDLDLFSARLVGDTPRIRAYLQRVHEYRTNGSLFDERRFFSFIDNDWNGSRHYGYPDPYTTSLTWELEGIYGNNYIRREWSDNTGKQDYLGVMAHGGAEFVYQWIHSSPQQIYFDEDLNPNPDNILTLEELVSHNLQGSFYNLFNCSISRYTEPDGNIAGELLFGERGLATIGSTKVGGIFNPQVLHRALIDGEGFGESLRLWFNDTWAYRADYGFDEDLINDWWLGMMLQGDPLLTLHSPTRSPSPRMNPPRLRYSPEVLDRLNAILHRQAGNQRVLGYLDSFR